MRVNNLCGSVLRDDFRPDSDVCWWSSSRTRISYFDMATMELGLADFIGRKVDLREPEELSRHFRQKGLVDSADLLYERAWYGVEIYHEHQQAGNCAGARCLPT